MIALALLAAVAAGSPPAGDLAPQLLAVERAFYAGWQAKDLTPFERGLAADSIAFGGFGAFDRKAQLQGQAQSNARCEVKSFALGDPRALRVSADAAVLYYTLAQDASCGGAKVESPLANTSVYAWRDGRWVNVFRTFAPIPGQTGK